MENQLLEPLFKNVSIFSVLLSLVAPSFFVLVIIYLYKKTVRLNNRSMPLTLFLFSTIASGANFLILSNLVTAFALIGTMGIIGFKVAVKSTIDASYIFLSLVLGLACGAGHFISAAIILFVFSVIIITHWKATTNNNNSDFNIEVDGHDV